MVAHTVQPLVDPLAHAGLVALVMHPLRRRGLQAADLQDVEQTLWLKLVLSARRYDPARAKFSTFAVRNLRRSALSHLKSTTTHRLTRVGLGPLCDADEPSPVDTKADKCPEPADLAAAAIDGGAFVARWLSRLNPREKAAVLARFDFATGEVRADTDEVGRQLGVSAAAAARLLCRAESVALAVAEPGAACAPKRRRKRTLGSAPSPPTAGRTCSQPRKIDESHHPEIVRRFWAGDQKQVIARDLGVSDATLNRVLLELGLRESMRRKAVVA